MLPENDPLTQGRPPPAGRLTRQQNVDHAHELFAEILDFFDLSAVAVILRRLVFDADRREFDRTRFLDPGDGFAQMPIENRLVGILLQRRLIDRRAI